MSQLFKPDIQKETRQIELPFYPDNGVSCQYFLGDDDTEHHTISSTSVESNDFYHDLCDNCSPNIVKSGLNEVKVWTNPNGDTVSLIVVPTNFYNHIYSFQIDKLDDVTRNETVFTQDEVDNWLKEVSRW